MFLQVLGVLFLLLICAAGFFFWRLYRLARKRSGSDLATAIAVLPAMEMELEPSSARDWKEIQQLEYAESELKSVGAAHVGYYCVYHGHATIRVSMWNYRGALMGTAIMFASFTRSLAGCPTGPFVSPRTSMRFTTAGRPGTGWYSGRPDRYWSCSRQPGPSLRGAKR